MDNLTTIERVPAPRPSFPLIGEMYVERGDRSDWELLHELHYKAEGVPAGPRYWRCVLRGETIGVMVTASPKLLLKERHKIFPNLKPGHDTKISNTYRANWLNANVRVIARFVVDTMYRGISIGYRFQNIATRLENNTYMEIQSSMSKYNLFAQKAGFLFVKPSNSNKYDIGMKFFRATFAANPADGQALLAELDGLAPALRERVIEETRDFYYRHSALEKTGSNRDAGRGKVDAMPVPVLIKNLQQMVLASPMYGVFKSPDPKKIMPERLPLTAFDTQAPNAPLDQRWFT